MQQLLWLTLVALVTVVAGSDGSCAKDLVIQKSFTQSVRDCVEYLDLPEDKLRHYLVNEFPADDDTKRMIRCTGLDLQWWNDTTGVQQSAIGNLFNPVEGDKQFEKRTTECLNRKVLPLNQNEVCNRAYEAFQCYFHEFGNLVSTPQYVPLSKLQATQVALDCVNMLQTPRQLLKYFCNGHIPDAPETRCLYRCIDVRSGLHTDEEGFDLQRFYLRDFQFADRRYLLKDTKACCDRIRKEGLDRCSTVYRTHKECLSNLGDVGYTERLIAEAAKISLGLYEMYAEKPTTLEAAAGNGNADVPKSSDSSISTIKRSVQGYGDYPDSMQMHQQPMPMQPQGPAEYYEPSHGAGPVFSHEPSHSNFQGPPPEYHPQQSCPHGGCSSCDGGYRNEQPVHHQYPPVTYDSVPPSNYPPQQHQAPIMHHQQFNRQPPTQYVPTSQNYHPGPSMQSVRSNYQPVKIFTTCSNRMPRPSGSQVYHRHHCPSCSGRQCKSSPRYTVVQVQRSP